MKLDARPISFAAAFIIVIVVTILPAQAEVVELPDGSKADLSSICPVCNMKAESGALGPAALVLRNGSVTVFDGPGDLFRYLLAPGKYGFDTAGVKNVFVTNYLTKTFMDAKKAYYVTGSDVSGGMGQEAVPFSTREAAEKFNTEHRGKALLTYSEVTLDHLKTRKKILKMEQDKPGGGHGH